MYCTKHCPNCHREVFDQDIIYGDSKEYCRYCRVEVEEEERQILEDNLDDEDEYVSLSPEELQRKIKRDRMTQKAKLKKQEESLKKAEEKARKSKINLIKLSREADGKPIPKNLEDLSDKELDELVEPLMERFIKGEF